MTYAIEVVLALFLAGLSLLVYMMVRQVGVVTRRLPYRTEQEATIVEALAPGETCPVVEFTSHTGQKTFQLPLVPQAASFLLFTSFSCTKCRAIMEQLSDLPDSILDRLVVMVLDSGFAEYFATDIERMGLARLRMVDAYDLATPFHVEGVPFLYTVDADHRITDGTMLVTPRDLLQLVRKPRALSPALGG